MSYEGIEDYDEIFLSCVFSFTKLYEQVLDLPYVHFGGTGIYPDGGEDLPYEVEHSKPDYSLYQPYVDEQLAKGRRRSALADYLDYSIGFTTRGCFRKCSFCVNKKTIVFIRILLCQSFWMKAVRISICGTITSWHLAIGKAFCMNCRKLASRSSFARGLMFD